jgi:ABC-type polysaccharide/polyol phosphate transport system ATPase subunit
VPPAVRVDDVSKCFRIFRRPLDRLVNIASLGRARRPEDFWALRGASFEVRRGESVGFLGANGSGKSTLLQMICGTMAPSAGCIETQGRISALLELGAGFNPDFTGRENVFLNAGLLGMGRRETERRLPDIIAFAEIGDFLDRPVRSYSSGMFVRLAFAVAANVSPDILIVDEALAVGDVFFQQKCYSHMRHALAGATKLFVTHDMNALSTMTDRIIVIDRGRITFDGGPTEAIRHYHRTVHGRRLLGDTRLVDETPRPFEASDGGAPSGVALLPIAADCKSGLGEIDIARYAVMVNGNADTSVSPGDAVDLIAEVVSGKDYAVGGVMGFTVSDRYGQQIFGQYTAQRIGGSIPLRPGTSLARLRFTWPRLCADDYSLTLGIGEMSGTTASSQNIQCWANHVTRLHCVNGEVRHGIFSVGLDGFTITQMG